MASHQPKPANEQQFLEAYDKHSDALFRYCYYRVFDREKAKDCVQEAYARTWKYMIDGNTIENIRAFLYRTANNIIIDASRKQKSSSLDTIMEKGFSPSIDPRNKTQDYLAGKELIKLVKTLDEKYRDVIILKYVEDLSTKEISFILNETENNIYVRISRGLKKIKKILKNQESAFTQKIKNETHG
jgi:RNA polymerase sigma-70 factor (ECF subfamily)